MTDITLTFRDVNVQGGLGKQISFKGQLDETNVDEKAKQVYQVISEMNPPYLILDFTELEYMNSKSIGYLTDWFTQAIAKNGKMVICNPRPNILDILKVVGITQIMSVFGSLEKAQESFMNQNTEDGQSVNA